MVSKLFINNWCIDNDDNFDEDNIPGYTHPSLDSNVNSPAPNKGKSREHPEQLAPPSLASAPRGPSLSGNIGSSGATKGARKMVGGVQVETR